MLKLSDLILMCFNWIVFFSLLFTDHTSRAMVEYVVHVNIRFADFDGTYTLASQNPVPRALVHELTAIGV